MQPWTNYCSISPWYIIFCDINYGWYAKKGSFNIVKVNLITNSEKLFTFSVTTSYCTKFGLSFQTQLTSSTVGLETYEIVDFYWFVVTPLTKQINYQDLVRSTTTDMNRTPAITTIIKKIIIRHERGTKVHYQ